MVSLTGANPDELDRLAGRFTHTASQVQAVQKSLNPRINTAPWHGRNADRFRQQWSGEHRRAIADAVAFLNQGATDLRTNAQQQRDASKAGGLAQESGGGIDWRSAWANVRTAGSIGSALTLGAALIAFPSLNLLKNSRLSAAQNVGLASLLRRGGPRLAKLVKPAIVVSKGMGSVGKILTAYGIASSLTRASEAHSRGDSWGVVRGVGGATYDAAGLIPVVGAMQTAWFVGYDGSKFLLDKAGYYDAVADNFMEQTLLRRYGTTTDLTPQQAKEISTRYDGVGGAFNYVQDSVLNINPWRKR